MSAVNATTVIVPNNIPPVVIVDCGDIPGGGQLQLVRRGDDYEILLEDEQLMGSWSSRSEEALATLVCERLGDRARRILIGGLGMGFTLAAARAALPAEATILVAELVPSIVSWARGPLSHIIGGSLDDPRVSIEMRDVHDVIEDHRGAFDAILLDVDNGPDGFVTDANERLYCAWGLRSAHAALRPGGILAVWSAYPDDSFRERLSTAGFAIEEIAIDVDTTGGTAPDILWLARRAQ